MTSRKEKIEALKRQLILHPSYLNIIEELEKDLHKLEQLEDIEKELEIDLLTLFEALKNGVYYFTNKKTQITKDYVVLVDNYMGAGTCDKLSYSFKTVFVGKTLSFEDYCETWALTKEELENDIKNIK